MRKATVELAAFAREMQVGDIPQPVIDEARRHILDCVAVSVAGIADPSSVLITDLAKTYGGAQESTLWGDGSMISAHNAALANGTISHSLDFDDTAYAIPGHFTVAVLPAVLVVAEKLGLSGMDAMAAYIAGSEVECKLAEVTGRGSWDVGWHTTTTSGVVGAAAAVARLMGLDQAGMQNAIGIAVSLASGVRQNFGTMTKPLHVGHNAYSAVLAADLASRGFTASAEAVEGDVGFVNVFGGRRERDFAYFDQLGNPFELGTSRVSIKAFPCCGSTHGSVGAALSVAGDGIAEDEIESAAVEYTYNAPLVLIYHEPTTVNEAKFSLEYCVATALLHGTVALGQFTPEAINAPDVQSLLRRVTATVPKEWEADAPGPWNMGNARIEVRLKDGTVLKGVNSARKGDAFNAPLSVAELEAKFFSCTEPIIGDSNARELLGVLEDFEHLDDVTAVTRRMVVG